MPDQDVQPPEAQLRDSASDIEERVANAVEDMTDKVEILPAESPGVSDEPESVPTAHPVKNLLFSTAIVTTAAVVGSMVTDPNSRWYKKLKKPDWQPDSSAFPIVWTALYAGAIATSTSVLNKFQREGNRKDAGKYRCALVVNMALNAGWSWTFFQAKKLGPAAAEAGALATSTLCLARRARKAGVGRCITLLPYAAWTAFAFGLSSELWLKNR